MSRSSLVGGNYSYRVLSYFNEDDTLGYSNIIDFEVDLSLSLDKPYIEDYSLSIYPNPVHQVLNIVLFEPKENIICKLYDSRGTFVRKIFPVRKDNNNFYAYINNLSSGIYFLEIYLEDIVVIKKIIKD